MADGIFIGANAGGAQPQWLQLARANRHGLIAGATGTGKTWVLQALMVWQILNANRAPDSDRYTKNFLVVAPGLIVYDRLLDAFMGKERDGKRDFTISDLSIFSTW